MTADSNDRAEAKGCCVPSRAAAPASPGLPVNRPVRGSGNGRCAVEIPGGGTIVGTDAPVFAADGEGPARRVALRPFRLDAHVVTNRRFAAFVAATGHRTEAERFGWSAVFRDFVPRDLKAERVLEAPWWLKIEGACWSTPEGPGSGIEDRLDHPVVHIAWADAAAFATWAGGRSREGLIKDGPAAPS